MSIAAEEWNVGSERAGRSFEGIGVKLEGAGMVEFRESEVVQKAEHDYSSG